MVYNIRIEVTKSIDNNLFSFRINLPKFGYIRWKWMVIVSEFLVLPTSRNYIRIYISAKNSCWSESFAETRFRWSACISGTFYLRIFTFISMDIFICDMRYASLCWGKTRVHSVPRTANIKVVIRCLFRWTSRMSAIYINDVTAMRLFGWACPFVTRSTHSYMDLGVFVQNWKSQPPEHVLNGTTEGTSSSQPLTWRRAVSRRVRFRLSFKYTEYSGETVFFVVNCTGLAGRFLGHSVNHVCRRSDSFYVYRRTWQLGGVDKLYREDDGERHVIE